MTPWVTRLIVANVVIFLLTSLAPGLVESLVFFPALILVRPWTILTYMFLHANIQHILLNMLSLFFFGPRLEFELGERKFLILYFISGISGAILSMIFSPEAAILGASGAVYGVMLGFAYLWPKEPIYIWGIFPVQARWLVLFMTVMSLLGGSGLQESGIAHFAHLGGFLGAYIYLAVAVRRGERSAPAAPPVPAAPSADEIRRWSTIQPERLHPVNREEYQRISNKLRTHGGASLSPSERAFLDRFSSL